jgi:hypothetical protein
MRLQSREKLPAKASSYSVTSPRLVGQLSQQSPFLLILHSMPSFFRFCLFYPCVNRAVCQPKVTRNLVGALPSTLH